MYSSALSQPSLEKTGEPETGAGPDGGSQPEIHSIGDTSTTSQTLPVVPLTTETTDTLAQAERYASQNKAIMLIAAGLAGCCTRV